VRQPITFAYGNLVFGEGPGDAWAVYRLHTRSYAGLTRSAKRELLSTVASLVYALEADFSLLRVARPWSVDTYAHGVETTIDPRNVRREALDQYLARQEEGLGERGSHTPEVYLSVKLPNLKRSLASDLGGISSIEPLRKLFGLSDGRAVSGRQLDALLVEEERLFQSVLDYVDCDRAASYEIQWLIRRAFCRALGDPHVDERFLPQALVVDAPEADGGVRFQPLETDILRLFDAPINVEARALRIESELGDSYQAFLCVGALPEVVPFPSRRAELLFAPLEALEFPVDVAFSARFVANEDAVRLVRRRIIDADHIYDEESHGDHGPSANAAERPQAARELEDYLTSADHPPLLRAGITLCVSAESPEELEDRVERLRREFGAIRLHRPLGEQLRLFVGHLPAQRSPVPDYDDYLTVEQFGAMVPTATHAVGADVGPYLGYTLSGAMQPVMFDPTEASRTSRAPATLLSGTLGSGKTLCMELIMYQALLAGSTICDIDPKGDHHLERLPGVAEHMEVIELSPDDRFRGMLDPLRVGLEDNREDLACNFLFSILPEPVAPGWQTEIRLAVQSVAATGDRDACCADVIAELEGGNEDARDAGRALTIHASSGLARLGFGTREHVPVQAGSKQVTSLRIRNLSLPPAGTARSEMLDEERVSQAVLHLLAVYALRLTSFDERRHSVLGFDEAWVLLADTAGRALVDRISRLGRSRNVTPLLATQVLGDVDELEGLIGAAFCFGVEIEREARKALRLLHLDEDDSELIQRLMSYRRGRCLMRDFEGRVSPVQVDLVDDSLLEALDTTPGEPGEEAGGVEEPDEPRVPGESESDPRPPAPALHGLDEDSG
jgi:hypothetical protein